MRKSHSKRIVVDTSVAHAAGESIHPTSSACRQWLLKIEEICHKVVLSEELFSEWNEHASRFTRKWKTKMAGRGKPVREITNKTLSINYQLMSKKEAEAVKKDLCLLSSALSNESDGIILTCDNQIKEILEKTQPEVMKRIQWMHPVDDSSELLHNLHKKGHQYIKPMGRKKIKK